MSAVGAPSAAPPLAVVVLGATATGKSALAAGLARRFGGEVINADSRQVYRGLEIGAAAPGQAERGAVPHHLFGCLDPDQTYSAARFAAEARATVAEVAARGRLPIVAGGTGLYLRALLGGLFAGPGRGPAHVRLERIADRGGLPRLHRWLVRVDPEWGGRVAPGDRQRVLRGLDVYLQSGRPMSDHIRRAPPAAASFRALKIGLELGRPELYARIDARVEQMLAYGMLDEVRALLAGPGFAASNAAKAVGYRQTVAHLAGELTLGEALRLWKRDTRRLAKRQVTWFRREPEVHWLPAHDPDRALARAVAIVAGALFGVSLEPVARASQ